MVKRTRVSSGAQWQLSLLTNPRITKFSSFVHMSEKPKKSTYFSFSLFWIWVVCLRYGVITPILSTCSILVRSRHNSAISSNSAGFHTALQTRQEPQCLKQRLWCKNFQPKHVRCCDGEAKSYTGSGLGPWRVQQRQIGEEIKAWQRPVTGPGVTILSSKIPKLTETLTGPQQKKHFLATGSLYVIWYKRSSPK